MELNREKEEIALQLEELYERWKNWLRIDGSDGWLRRLVGTGG